MKVLLSKQKENGGREFFTVYFNSTAKAIINLIIMVLIIPSNKFYVD